MLRILSLGAGVQSSTIALMAAQGQIDMPDYAIFADTQSEPDSVYRWLDWLECQLPYPVIRVTAGNLAERILGVRTSKAGTQYFKPAFPAWIQDENGQVQLMRQRNCTADFKITPILKKLRELGGKKAGVEQYIGISMDERIRIKPSRNKWIENRWPLIEKRMARHDCLNWMERNGYPKPPRSSCWFCPYHSNAEWHRLKTEEPKAFAKAEQWEIDFQKTIKKIKAFRGTPYLHRSCTPLSEIDFNAQSPQTDLFGNECNGLCGV